MPATDGASLITSRSTGTDYASFDTKALVEAKLQPQTTRISRLSDEVKANTAKVTAYADLRAKLQALGTASQALRAAPDSGGKAADVFRARAAYLTSSAGGDAGTYLSASVKDGTATGSHTVSVVKIAKADILGAASQSSKTDPLGWTGTISLGVAGGAQAKVKVDAEMSLGEVAAAINAETGNTKVAASVMKISEGRYQLVFSATETGKAMQLSDADGGSLLADPAKLGMLDDKGQVRSGAVLQAAQKAELVIDGVPLVRDGNDIGDVLDGVTLHLYAEPPTGTVLKLEIDHDLNAVKKAVAAFVEAYNALRGVVVANQATKSDGTANDNTPLFGDLNLRAIGKDVQDVLSSSVGGVGLAELGIRFDAQNQLLIDETVFGNALLNRFDAVETLFSYKAAVSSGDLQLLRHPNASFDFKLNVTVDATGNVTGADVDGDASAFTVSGGAIVGKAGSAYEGLTLVYTGKTSKTISVKLTQGMADRLHGVADKFADADRGTLSAELSSLNKDTDDLNRKIETLKASTQSYANYLYTLYGKMAARISEAQTTIKLFKALLKSGLD